MHRSLASPAQHPLLSAFSQRFLRIRDLKELYERARQTGAGSIYHGLLDQLQVGYDISPEDLARIPKNGPIVAVANHPFGMLEGPVLGTLLPQIRPDVKVLTNQLLATFPELNNFCIWVDPFGGRGAVESNRRAMRESLAWLRSGGMLVIFPAGTVSYFQPDRLMIADPHWNTTAARLIRATRAAALPLFFKGQNSAQFQVLGILHPSLRTAALPSELLNKKGTRVTIRVASPIKASSMAHLDDEEATRYLRSRTYLLGSRDQPPRRLPSFVPLPPKRPVVPALPSDELADEIARLSRSRLLDESGGMQVYIATAQEIPNVLHEIGRLREITFRETGEGTGRAIDLDPFDPHYLHLFLWHPEKDQVVGAYRLGPTEELLVRGGVPALYTSTLFDFDRRLLDRLGPCLELGRSFVRPEYQRQYAPLFLLWRGIARYLAMQPATPVLFGAVSISASYHRRSRELLVGFLERQPVPAELRGLVRPRRPFRHSQGLRRPGEDQALTSIVRDLDELGGPIGDIEGDGKGVPVLLRQYCRLGGQILAFNVDRAFSGCLDGLVLVDLRRTDRTLLDRYMGRDGAERFLRYHGLESGSIRQSTGISK